MSTTFMQQLSEHIVGEVETEEAKTVLRGLSKAQMVETVQALCRVIDELPQGTNIHVLLAALTYVRNAVHVAIEENAKMLAEHTGGHG